MKYVLIIFLFLPLAKAQVNLLQSDANTRWLNLEDEHFQIIFPDYLEHKAHFTLNLLQYYRKTVAKTYQTHADKISVVLRPQMNQPNGFVTLAPRRSEWFHHASLTPLIGSLNFLQALAVHEYRHVIQFDAMKDDNLLYPYYFFGEAALGFFINFVMPDWYFEGDATWAETAYSDAGRGRSPRFSARLKALLKSQKIPKYDDLIAGDFTNSIPNLYVYGYFLVTHANKKYGSDVWKKILHYAIQRPWNVYAFYNGFEDITGQSFENFYLETMQELQSDWEESTPQQKMADFATEIYPLDEGYYLYRDLDSLWQLKKSNQLIKELNISPFISRIDKKEDKIIYTSLLPDPRYGFKNYSDLMQINLTNQKITPLTQRERYYHPQYSPSAQKIVATHINQKDQFSLAILNAKGISQSVTPKNPKEIFSEAVWRSETELLILTLAPDGKKYIKHFYLDTKDEINLTTPTRNNIYSLHYFDNKVFFEADYNGAVNIFALDLQDNSIKQCTHEPIGAFTPRVVDNQLYFAAEGAHGKRIKHIPINCKEIPASDLFENYIGSSPSDNYHQMAPVQIKDFSAFFKRNSQHTKKYSEYASAFIPHSWNFLGGRGYQLQGFGNNMLNTLGTNLYTGMTSEESQPFAGFSLSYSKYYPVLSLALDYLERNNKIGGDWYESKSLLSLLFPYNHVKGVYQGAHALSFSIQNINVSSNNQTQLDRLNDEQIISKGLSLVSSFTKFQPYRNLQPPWGYQLALNYFDIEQRQDNFLGSGNLNVFLPGWMKNDGFSLGVFHEYRPANTEIYQLLNRYVPTAGYTFSRGYAYAFSDQLTKFSFEYLTPIAYPRWGLSDWVYFKRLNGKIFVDTTNASLVSVDNTTRRRTLNSVGLEFSLNSQTFRKFPINYGLRMLQRSSDQKNLAEFFLSLNL